MLLRSALVLGLACVCLAGGEPRVGEGGRDGVLVASGRRIQPAGDLLTFAGRAMDLVAAPDGSTLYVKTDRGLVVVDAAAWRVRQTLAWPAGDTGSMRGLALDEGGRVWLTLGTGALLEAERNLAGGYRWGRRLALPSADARSPYPCGLALEADGRRALVVLGRNNTLAEVDLEGGRVLRELPVGVAPCALAVAGTRAFVANWGGGRAAKGQRTMASSGTPVAVDGGDRPLGGTVSAVDLEAWRVDSERDAGLHPCAALLAPAGGALYVADANADTVSVLDPGEAKATRAFPVTPQAGLPFGSLVSALALDPRDGTLFAACGGCDAVAVLREGVCAGFIPGGGFPSCLAVSGTWLYVGSAQGLGSRDGAPDASRWSVRRQQGTLQRVSLPVADLAGLTRRVRNLNGAGTAPEGPQARTRRPAPVPRQPGEPSVFKHVVYVLKENRTYDQVLGDLPQGSGDARLCLYGREVTPNHHALAERFVLLDNYYCNGVVSADGHQWATQGITTVYQELAAGDWTRSYDFGTDPLAFAPTPFLWDSALARGRTFRNYGEFDFPALEPASATWNDVYADFRQGTAKVAFRPAMAMEGLRRYTAPGYPGWDLRIPDQVRLERFLAEFRDCERTGGFPDLVLVYLPQDHTRGLEAGAPTPRAHLADNDLALGRLVEAISHSRFWKDTCIFVNEDDPQDGFDHVDGHRSLCLVASPYTLRGKVVSRFYNQTSVLRTIELMLGLPPLNRMDAAAPDMAACFSDKADLTPFDALPSRVPLDELNPAPGVAGLDFSRPDRIDDDLFNRMLWRAARGGRPYPGAYAGAHGKGLRARGLKLASRTTSTGSP